MQVILNPGATVEDTAFFSVADQIVTYESYYASFRYVFRTIAMVDN